MTDTEKIEWLSAINKALMESQERLAGEIKELRQMLGDTRAFLAIHVWDNERSCCFYCGEKDYGVTADDCRQAPDYELAKKIDEVLK